jgi:hypothetical protein
MPAAGRLRQAIPTEEVGKLIKLPKAQQSVLSDDNEDEDADA